ncbi:MAG: argininosuccinate lyase [Xanthomonadales bacterium]|nr:argininosuccinate lyase [Xanthomonadales bacterium]MBP6078987.1 argininosuccinate lyase [Xanthomonadales bacterium]MBP7623251.1 argininosuccinate lyase [Xanthomonadales bacterium]
MTAPIWNKRGVEIDADLMRFMAGEDVRLDRELFVHDIAASAAHARGLVRVGILTSAECAQLEAELAALTSAFAEESFVLDARFEDGHSAIESWLTDKLGDLGRKIHTGRSRNDQVLVALRLWLKAQLRALQSRCVAIAGLALARVQREGDLPMPGYTHLQRAMVSSTGLWWAAMAESFIDNAELAARTLAWVDANPLGTASGYGVNLALDREGVTADLGFARTLVNPIAAQLSRGKYEWQALAALAQALNDVRRFAWDLSLFTSAEFDFVALPNAFTTGSSLMPNKRNPDVVELLRASPSVVQGAMLELQSLSALPLGYHRDMQAGKGPVLRAFAHGLDALAIAARVFEAVAWKPERMRAAIDAGMYATDRAIELAAAGVPFREAYRQAADVGSDRVARTPEGSLAARTSPGAAGDLGMTQLQVRLTALQVSI